MEDTLAGWAEWSLQQRIPKNERLVASSPTEASKGLLARCYLTMNHDHRVLPLLADCSSDRNRYLRAKAAYRLEKYSEALSSLLKKRNDIHSVVEGAVGYLLLGQKLSHSRRAILCYKQALQKNPFLWVAYEELCNLGCNEGAEKFFGCDENAQPMAPPAHTKHIVSTERPQNSPALHTRSRTKKTTSASTTDRTPGPQISAPPVVARKKKTKTVRDTVSTPQLASKIVRRIYPSVPAFSLETPKTSNSTESNLDEKDFAGFSLSLRTSLFGITPNVKSSQRSPFIKNSQETPSSNEHSTVNELPPVRKHTKRTGMRKVEMTPSAANVRISGGSLFSSVSHTPPPVKRSSRLSKKADRTRGSPNVYHRLTDTASPHPTPIEPLANRTNYIPILETQQHEKEATQSLQQGTEEVLKLLRICGKAIQHSRSFQGKKALKLFHTLPQEQYNTPWVLSEVGRVYTEMVKYHKAKSVFSQLRRLDATCLRNMEHYSVVLWHLRDAVKLSYLSHTLIDANRRSPSSWCALGNCFSLKGEHKQACQYFQRAIHLDPSFAYAHTLMGHEYIALDRFDQAQQCFRDALSISQRHYNAWFGLGLIDFKQEKWSSAKHLFKKAISINPRNAVLHCYVGMVLQIEEYHDDALDELATAVELDSNNTLALYKLASVHAATGNFTEALNTCSKLLEISTKEPAVFFLMGRIYHELEKIQQGEGKEQAIKYYSLALDYDSKNQKYIAAALARLTGETEDESEEDDEDEPDLDLM